VGESAGVQHDLLDGDGALVFAGKLGQIAGDSAGSIYQSFGDHLPHRRRHKRLCCREIAEPSVEICVAEGVLDNDFALVAKSDLAAREQAFVHLAADPVEKFVDLFLYECHGGTVAGAAQENLTQHLPNDRLVEYVAFVRSFGASLQRQPGATLRLPPNAQPWPLASTGGGLGKRMHGHDRRGILRVPRLLV
jgi:hypothetical protein